MAIIGTQTVPKGDRKYFYKITRNSNQEIILSKVEVFNSQGENIVLNDPAVLDVDNQHVFGGFNTDYTVVNVDQNKQIVDLALGVSQYKVRTENITYFVNDNGDLIARLDT